MAEIITTNEENIIIENNEQDIIEDINEEQKEKEINNMINDIKILLKKSKMKKEYDSIISKYNIKMTRNNKKYL